jgi:redox-sensitive bicupin YhaK (pirin superfamily)
VSNLDPAPEAIALMPGVVRAVDALEARKAAIGDGTEVRRLLPQRTLRTVGAWCFLDHYGPDDVSIGPGIQVPPHPHIGLQTVSWLLDGLVLHRDSLGSRQMIRPGELNLMTAGRGIAHSEESAAGRPAALHGLQLWIALPEQDRFVEPRFAHHANLLRGSPRAIRVSRWRRHRCPRSPLSLADARARPQWRMMACLRTGPESQPDAPTCTAWSRWQ